MVYRGGAQPALLQPFRLSPVKKEANDIARLETALSVIDQKDVTENLRASLRVAVDTVNQASLYTNKAFQGGTDARNVLETSP